MKVPRHLFILLSKVEIRSSAPVSAPFRDVPQEVVHPTLAVFLVRPLPSFAHFGHSDLVALCGVDYVWQLRQGGYTC